MGWDATNQEEQEHTRQQAVWIDHQGFKPGLLGERGVLVSDREELENTVTLRGNLVKPLFCPRHLWEGFSRKVMLPKAQLDCFCSNVCSMGNEEELETDMGWFV